MLNGLTLVCPLVDGQAVWHVSVGFDQPPMLTGAWRIDGHESLGSFTVRRIVLDGPEMIEASLGQMAEEIRQLQGDLQRVFDAHVAGRKTKLIAPRWPQVPNASDPERLQAAGTPVELRPTLAYARWAQALLVAWNDTETQRLLRSFLIVDDTRTARAFPPAWSGGWVQGAAA